LKIKYLCNLLIQRTKTRYCQIPFHPMDFVVIGYLILLGFLIILFHHNIDVKHWWKYPVIHLILSCFIVEFIRFASQTRSKLLHFLRTFYPALLLTFAWTELGPLINMIFPFWVNDFAIKLDKAIFSVHPTIWVGQNLYKSYPWLTELMNFFYAFYFLFIPIGGFSLYFRQRKQKTLDFLFLVMFTYTISFLLFFIFPVECPKHIPAINNRHTIQATGWIFLKLNQFIQGHGSIRGAAFPSSHVAAAFTIVWATLRYNKKLGLILLIFSIGVAISTVYCQYHHAVDALAGIISGTILYGVGILILKKWKSSIKPEQT